MKKWLLLFIVLTLSIFVYGCGTQKAQGTTVAPNVNGEPAKVLQSYLDNISHNKFADAYELLATSNKQQMNKEDFVTFYGLSAKVQRITGFKIESSAKLGSTTGASVQYQDSYAFNIRETYRTVADNKTNTASGQLKVVKENGNWKVLWDHSKTIKQMISQSYANLGWTMGPDKPTETINDFNEALKYDDNNSQAYLGLSVLELQLKGFDKAIAYANQGLAKTQDLAAKAQFNSVIGQAYFDQTDLVNANKFFTLALQEDPNNTNAQQGLDDIKKQK